LRLVNGMPFFKKINYFTMLGLSWNTANPSEK